MSGNRDVMKKLFIHYVVTDYFPEQGGMQQSLRRISNSLKEYWEDSVCDFYVLTSRASDYDNVHFIQNRIKRYTHSIAESEVHEQKKEQKQLQYMVLQSLLGDTIEKNPDHSHLIVSFYASHAGFYAQLIASYYGIPHITSIRGSDFYNNYLNHISFGSMDFVIKRADYIVTTNNMQKRMLSALYPGEISDKIFTIHNAMEGVCHKYINRVFGNSNKQIRLVYDGGFSYKKGAKTIMDCFEILNNNGFPVELVMAGEISERESSYWDKKICAFRQTYGEHFKYIGYCTDVSTLFEESDIYVSASLSEGCSNSRILALCIGIPIVTTNVGAILDYPFDRSFISFIPASDTKQMTTSIITMVEKLKNNQIVVSDVEIQKRREYFSLRREQNQWVELIKKIPSI